MPKNIVITGANGALGTAVVKKFLEAGYKVIAVDRSGKRPAYAKDNPQYAAHKVNLDNEQETAQFAQEAIKQYAKIDGVLMLAGGFAMGDIKATDGNALKKMFSLNFETAYYLARPLFQHMMENGYGRLVFIGSRPALNAAEGRAKLGYTLSKSLLFKLAELLNAEAKGKNVVSCVIVPSTIDTEENRESMPDAKADNWVKAEQIADVLEFICSEKGDALREPVLKLYNNA
jgi:NAD(P)-dependent dehydrogenase (short-subunit alcohol dehydrogenase family)